ncbi:MAG: ribonuclease H-like domain-containing protein [Candidatus Paceibacterota bacterium]
MINSKFPNILVFDIETIGNISSPNFVDEMQITVVGVYNYNTDEYKTYFLEELSELESDLKQAHLLVGFNNDHFDTPILNKYYQFDLFSIASFDILREFKANTGKRLGLDAIASMTLGANKSGTGFNAINLYQEGKLQELADYCLNDVKLTKDIFEYCITKQHLIYPSRDGWLRLKVDMKYDLDDFILNNTQKSQYTFL